MKKKGLLLINLGTPKSPETKEVRTYLRQFLSDPRVVDIPILLRYLLLYFIILPFRSPKSSRAYKKIWSKSGSPLLHYSQSLTEKVGQKLSSTHHVALGMRYGEPSIAKALDEVSHCEEIQVLPLFPQYASSSYGSAVEEFLSQIKGKNNIPPFTILPTFYEDQSFIRNYTSQMNQTLNQVSWDHILFSYHGLPERHLQKSDCKYQTKCCEKEEPCPSINSKNRYCYKAQCYETTRCLAQNLNLQPHQYDVCFQSRLGRTPWVKPYTDEILGHLRTKGIKNIVVVCPSFVADCLETLEEIGMGAKEDWRQMGGQDLHLVPCLNDNSEWVDTVSAMALEVSSQKATQKHHDINAQPTNN